MDFKLRTYQIDDTEKKTKVNGFFRSYGSNWSRVCACNGVLLLSNILSMVLSLMIVMLVFQMIFSFFLPDTLKDTPISSGIVTAESATDEAVENLYFLMTMFSSMMMIGFMTIVNGPIYTAISYYFRNLIRGDANFKSDFKKSLKENWKVSLGMSLLSILITFILLYNIGYYQQAKLGYVSTIARGFFTCLLVFWICMQIYVYPLIACVELKFKEVIKNAAILTVSNFPASMGIFLLELVLYAVIPFTLMITLKQAGYGIATLLYLLFSYGFVSFLSTHLTWKSIQKLIERNH